MPRLIPITAGSRESLRASFDSVAAGYQAARPEYPAEIFDTVVELAGLAPGARLLEVGPGPGKATLPLARRGFSITAVELGAGLAAEAAANLADFPLVSIHQGSFEEWPSPAEVALFDLVFAATAWHWIDPAVSYRRARQLLAPGGRLAFWSAAHVLPDGGDPFFLDLQDVYEKIGEAMPADTVWHRPGELPDQAEAIAASGLFEDIQVRQFDWEHSYDADSYIALLDTFSGHLAMDEAKRGRLYGEIRRRLALRPDGRLRRHWGAVLHVARANARPR